MNSRQPVHILQMRHLEIQAVPWIVREVVACSDTPADPCGGLQGAALFSPDRELAAAAFRLATPNLFHPGCVVFFVRKHQRYEGIQEVIPQKVAE